MDADAENVFCLLLKSGHIQERPSRVELDQKVDVALGSLVSASDRAEYAKVPHAVPPR